MANAPEVQQLLTHASRHPLKKSIPPRANNVKRSKAGQVTANVGLALKKERKAAFDAEVTAFTKQRDQTAEDLAVKYNLKVPFVRLKLSNALLLKQPRHPNIWNALVSRRSRELNEGRAVGKCLMLAEVQAKVREEIENGKHNGINGEELIEELEEKRQLQAQGTRSSNRAAMLDYNGTLLKFKGDFADLYQRTGALGFAFFTRGHVLDGILPGMIQSQSPANDTAVSMRTEAVNLINNGLQRILAKGNVMMSYENYETMIVKRYGVILRGWPEGLKFQSPAKITLTSDARLIRDALISGECIWAKLSKEQREQRANARKEAVANGEVVPKQRKKRADAGKPCGPRKNTPGGKRKRGDDEDGQDGSNAENNPPRKMTKTLVKQMPPMATSKEYVDDDSEGEQ
ncbi:hypothetical protein H0H92_004469 [Tricholoma furcatifolium]|nr:hypothetical protein H0H92_004469 [Tricholoma furcatifolium]